MYISRREILEKAKSVINKTFGEIDQYQRLKNRGNKGGLGHIIEESLFGYEINSNKLPDFEELGIELKVTPYKINKNKTKSAKERLVLNIIDFDNIVKHEFESSSFWKKNEHLLLLFYLHDYNKSRKDYLITDALLYDYPEEDLQIMKQDYYTIKQKVLDGKAHEISEGDTLYLGACTKGSGKGNFRHQPFSDELAKQRAFSFKTKYMTYLLRNYVFGKKENEKIIKNPEILKNITLENFIISKLNPYINQTVSSLCERFNLNTNAKHKESLLVSRMLEVYNIGKSEEFQKSGMKFKTIHFNKNNKNKESMSFPHFDFIELYNETWEESSIREMFETTKFVFAVFKTGEDGFTRFKGINFWNMPNELIEKNVKQAWSRTKNILATGNIVKHIKACDNGKEMWYNNFPKASEKNVIHVRPHARNKKDTLPLPVKDIKTGNIEYPKQCFWINSRFIRDLLKNLLIE